MHNIIYVFYAFLFSILLNQIYSLDFCGYLTSDSKTPTGVTIKTFENTLDPFNPKSTKWNQTYLVRDNLWEKKNNAPVFLLLAGGYEASTTFMRIGAWYDWGKKYKALMFQLEHRYFGKSHPTDDTSLNNLKYLTVNNAVEDIGNFISQMKQDYNLTQKNKWVLFGGGYAGSLAVWAKLKKSNIIRGAIVSGAPLQLKSDFFEYQDLIRRTYQDYYPKCKYNISRSIALIQRKFQNDDGISDLKKEFNICNGFNGNNSLDKKFFYINALRFVHSANYNDETSTLKSMSGVCDTMDNDQIGDPDARLAKVYKDRTRGCLSASYKATVSYYDKTSWKDVVYGSRQNLYMNCNEIGLFYTTPSTSVNFIPGLIPITFYEKLCRDVFGRRFDKNHLTAGINNLIQTYQGLDIEVENVVFVVGSTDPWRYLSIPRNPSRYSPLIYIEGSYHCRDMKTPVSEDSQDMKDARIKIENNLKQWLS